MCNVCGVVHVYVHVHTCYMYIYMYIHVATIDTSKQCHVHVYAMEYRWWKGTVYSIIITYMYIHIDKLVHCTFTCTSPPSVSLLSDLVWFESG